MTTLTMTTLTMTTLKKNNLLEVILTDAHNDYEKVLHAHAFFKIQNHAMSEDMIQDTFTKTWVYLLNKGKIDNMRAFLYHVLNDLIVDEYRKHKVISLDMLREKGFEPRTKNFERLHNILDGKATLLLILRLPEKYQKVMKMRYIEDLSLEEISHIVGKSKGTIAVHVYRGLKKLKLLYSPNTNSSILS